MSPNYGHVRLFPHSHLRSLQANLDSYLVSCLFLLRRLEVPLRCSRSPLWRTLSCPGYCDEPRCLSAVELTLLPVHLTTLPVRQRDFDRNRLQFRIETAIRPAHLGRCSYYVALNLHNVQQSDPCATSIATHRGDFDKTTVRSLFAHPGSNLSLISSEACTSKGSALFGGSGI